MRKEWNESTAKPMGLYDPQFEHDNCGIGAVVNIKGIKMLIPLFFCKNAHIKQKTCVFSHNII